MTQNDTDRDRRRVYCQDDDCDFDQEYDEPHKAIGAYYRHKNWGHRPVHTTAETEP